MEWLNCRVTLGVTRIKNFSHQSSHGAAPPVLNITDPISIATKPMPKITPATSEASGKIANRGTDKSTIIRPGIPMRKPRLRISRGLIGFCGLGLLLCFFFHFSYCSEKVSKVPLITSKFFIGHFWKGELLVNWFDW